MLLEFRLRLDVIEANNIRAFKALAAGAFATETEVVGILNYGQFWHASDFCVLFHFSVASI